MEILANGFGCLIVLGAPTLIYSCVLESSDEIDPTGAGVPSAGDGGLVPDFSLPLPPGYDPGMLPAAPAVVDTSPDQMIGCLSDGHSDPEYWLSEFFPAAVAGDGVIDRSTNDIWVFDGTNWNNVGDSPGETLLDAEAIEPFNVLFELGVITRNTISSTDDHYISVEDQEWTFLSYCRVAAGAGTAIKPSNGLVGALAAGTPEIVFSQKRGALNDYQYIEYLGTGLDGRILNTAVVASPRIFIDFAGAGSFTTKTNNAYTNSWRIYGTSRNIPYTLPAVSSDVTGHVTVNRPFNTTDVTMGLFMIGGAFGPVQSLAGDNATTQLQTNGTVSSQVFQLNTQAPYSVPHGLSGTPDLVIARRFTLTGTNVGTLPLLYGPALDAATGTSGSLRSLWIFGIGETNISAMPTLAAGASVNATSVSIPQGFASTGEIIAMAERQSSLKIGYYDGNGSNEWLDINTGFIPELVIIRYLGNPTTSSPNGQLNGLWQTYPSASGWILKRSVDPSKAVLIPVSNDTRLSTTKMRLGELTETGFRVRDEGDLPEWYLSLNHNVGDWPRVNESVYINKPGERYLYIAFGGANSEAIMEPPGLEVACNIRTPPYFGPVVMIPVEAVAVPVSLHPPRRVGEAPTVDLLQGLTSSVVIGQVTVETESEVVVVPPLVLQVGIGSPEPRTFEDDRTFGILSLLEWGLRGLL
jgi:hypothetical protein